MYEGNTPIPLGKIIPSLEGSYSYTTEDTPESRWVQCPSCESDNVCVLSAEHSGYGSIWFCISCQSSWEYVPDECVDE